MLVRVESIISNCPKNLMNDVKSIFDCYIVTIYMFAVIRKALITADFDLTVNVVSFSSITYPTVRRKLRIRSFSCLYFG